VNAVLLRSLPFREPERLVVLWESVRKEGARQPLSYPDFEDWRRQNRVFEQIAAGSGAESLTMTGRGTAQQVGAEYVTENFFAVLGIAPLLGRVFLPEENSPGGHHRVAVLSYEIWQRRFGADPGVINQVLVLNEISYTVIGVMPPGFRGESDRADLWLPFRSMALGFPVGDFVTDRQVRWHVGVGRLKPGVTLTQAQADLEGIARQLEAAYPDTNTGVGVWLQPMTEAWVGEFRAALLALLSAVGFVLLIACSNVANLQLGRARARRKELAVCAALGASRARLIRQLLTDSLLLAILGGLAGGLLAAWLTSALLAFSPIAFPSFVRVTLDWRVLSFASALSVLSGVLSGFLPAWTTTRADLASLLNEGRQTATREHRRLGASLVVAELALAVVLLVGAGLMIRSLLGLQQTDLGFDGRNLLTLRLHTGAQKYERPEAVVSLSEELLTRLAVLPGVASVALVQADLPPGGGYYGWPAELQGRPLTSPDAAIRLNQHRVSPGFFATF
ncbi:MAG: ABC transporter permease, partial [Terriglobia bacterium]